MLKKQKQEIIDDGFSSDEEIKHEQILIDDGKKENAQKNHREEVKFKIPPPQQIKVKSYSLHPDIATGWNQRSQGPMPIPLMFDDKKVDILVRKFSQKKSHCIQKMKLCYLGPRFQNTFYAWYDQKFSFPYGHFKAPKNMKFSNRIFCGQSQDCMDGLIFDSMFQSGNLDCVIKVDEFEYDLYLRVDSNTRGHLNWYNFKIKNMEKLLKYKINICNIQKSNTLYSRGMKPYIFSHKKFEKRKKGWEQGGDSVRFQQKISKSLKLLNLDYYYFSKLSFDLYTQYEKDEIQIAYCIPYTYTQLMNFLGSLEKKSAERDFFTLSKLCTSLGGLDVPILTIHQNEQQIQKKAISKKGNPKGVILTEQDDQIKIPKKCIVISGRVHPGESNASHMMQGFLQYLCGSSKEAKRLRTDFIIKIVPMLNPDGVCLGNYRTGISGKDFNREYKNPDRVIFPEVHAFKKLVSENKAIYKQNLTMFLDFHGHSTKKNVFMYGPQFPIVQKQYYESRMFPRLISSMTDMFRYYSCSFRINWDKVNTARAIFLRNLNINFSYTIQASNGSFYDQQTLKDHTFTSQSWTKMGSTIATALAKYGQMIINSQKNKIQKKKQRERKMKKGIRTKRTTYKNYSLANTHDNHRHDSPQQEENPKQLNDEMKKLIEEIKGAEAQREHELNEEDQIMEGSSDGQGQKEDLTPMKLKFLYQVIKNKKECQDDRVRRMRIQSLEEDMSLEESRNRHIMEEEQQKRNYHEISFDNFQQHEMTSSKFMNKKLRDARGCWFKSKHSKIIPQPHITMPESAPAAKIINFSFYGAAKQAPYYIGKNYQSSGKQTRIKDDKLFKLHSSWVRNPIITQIQATKSSRNQITDTISKQTCVLDLSNNNKFKRNVITAKQRSPQKQLNWKSETVSNRLVGYSKRT